MNYHHKQMHEAIALAKQGKNSKNGGAFGAVITKNNNVVCKVHNSVRGDHDCTQHAELKAIQSACKILKTKDLSDCVLYTSCEPCMMCLGACKWANFKAIYFGASAEDAKHYGYLYSDMYYNSNSDERHLEFNMTQICRSEAVAVWAETT
jgi:tRNA(Arg) A34 adenosine deaminase TadA